jgi:hypothetical protein
MDKTILTQIIESFYLNGLTSQVKFKVKNNEAHIKFAVDNKDCIGEVIAPITLEDCEIGIFNTSQLLKLLHITNDFIELKLEKQNNHFLKLHISDNQFDLSYNLSDLGLIQDPGVVPNLPPHDLEFDINFDFTQKYIKAHNALDKPPRFEVGISKDFKDDEVINFMIGEKSSYSNKVNFAEPGKITNKIKPIAFSANNFREVISVNKNATGKVKVYKDGLLKVNLEEAGVKSEYFLVALHE